MAPHTAHHDHTRTARTALLAGLLTVLSLLLPTRAALAQVEPTDPRWMTVTRETPMRCGELTTFYKVADLKPGTVVRVDALSTRWARLIYPENQFAFVAVGDADDVTETDLTLSTSARVRAPNAISGLSGSWRSLYLGDIPTDERLTIVGTAEARDGQVIGYKIEPPQPPVAPHPPYGYAELSALRDATRAEVEEHLAALEADDGAAAQEDTGEQAGGDDSARPSEPESVPDDAPTETETDAASQPERPAEQQPESAAEGEEPQETDRSDAGSTEPAESAQAEDDEPAPTPDESLLDDMVMPGDEPRPATPRQDTEAGDTGREAEPTGDGAVADDAAQTEPAADNQAASPPAPEKTWLDWRELESTLSRVRRAGGSVLEDALEELIAEYQRTRQHAEGESVRRAIDSRLSWLRARKATRDEKRALEAAMRQAEQLRSDAGQRRQEWEATRSYDMVGRLVTSAVYDGKRLPKMYRVQAVDAGGLTRTIGYIKPSPDLKLESMLGRVVGVIGEATLDTALRLRVITPTRVVPLRPAAGG